MGHYFAQIGHHFDQMGHQMGHHSAWMGHKMGHQSPEMGHKGTPMDTILMSADVMVKYRARRGGATRFSGATWLKNGVKVAQADPGQFCDFRRLWYDLSYKFSVLQGWRHGVRSRSLGGMFVSPAGDPIGETRPGFQRKLGLASYSAR